MSFWSLVVFSGGKYLYKNALERPSQVVNKLAFEFKRQTWPYSSNRKEIA